MQAPTLAAQKNGRRLARALRSRFASAEAILPALCALLAARLAWVRWQSCARLCAHLPDGARLIGPHACPAQGAFWGGEHAVLLVGAQTAWAKSPHLLVGRCWLCAGKHLLPGSLSRVQVLAVLTVAAAAVALSRRLLAKPATPVYLVDTGKLPRVPPGLCSPQVLTPAPRSLLARAARAAGALRLVHRPGPQAQAVGRGGPRLHVAPAAEQRHGGQHLLPRHAPQCW